MNQCLALIGKEVAIDECRDDVVALCLEGCRHDPEKEGGRCIRRPSMCGRV
jgi:hypothetical protein